MCKPDAHGKRSGSGRLRAAAPQPAATAEAAEVDAGVSTVAMAGASAAEQEEAADAARQQPAATAEAVEVDAGVSTVAMQDAADARGGLRCQDAIVITNRALVKGDFLTQMARVLSFHPHAVILREKDLSDAAYEALARALLPMCRAAQVPCFLHGHIALAQKLGCRCIHLPLAALEQQRLENLFDEISVSCHSMEDVQRAVAGGATQIVLGTIFETECKRGLKGRGLDFVREVTAACPIPVYAIGGITFERIPLVQQAGAAGGCMMSGFMTM